MIGVGLEALRAERETETQTAQTQAGVNKDIIGVNKSNKKCTVVVGEDTNLLVLMIRYYNKERTHQLNQGKERKKEESRT